MRFHWARSHLAAFLVSNDCNALNWGMTEPVKHIIIEPGGTNYYSLCVWWPFLSI